jgi:hypothetical protein
MSRLLCLVYICLPQVFIRYHARNIIYVVGHFYIPDEPKLLSAEVLEWCIESLTRHKPSRPYNDPLHNVRRI